MTLAKETRRVSEIIKVKTASFFAQLMFLINSYTLSFKTVNQPDVENENFIFALWHAHQCATYAISNRSNLCSLISRSTDGDIITASAGRVGIRAIRGSSKRGGASAALKLIDEAKKGVSLVIAVDGPRGPKFKAKLGIIEIARKSGVPIVPMAWYGKSPFLVKFNTWDEFMFPFIFGTTVTLFGKPIAVPEDADDEECKRYLEILDKEMHDLNRDLRDNYDYYLKNSVKNNEKSKSLVKWF